MRENWMAEEFYTVGFQEFDNKNDYYYDGPTENSIRQEEGWKKRGAYLML